MSPESLHHKSGLTPLQQTLQSIIDSRNLDHATKQCEVALTLLRYSELDVINARLCSRSPLQLAILTSRPTIILTIIAKGASSLSKVDVEQALHLMDSCFKTCSDNADSYEEIIEALHSLNSRYCPSLQELSRNTVRRSMTRRLSGVHTLPCTSNMKRYILLDQFATTCSCQSTNSSATISHSVPKTRMREQVEFFTQLF